MPPSADAADVARAFAHDEGAHHRRYAIETRADLIPGMDFAYQARVDVDRSYARCAAYLLAATVTMPIYGRMADLYGRRRVLLAAISLFGVGSWLARASILGGGRAVRTCHRRAVAE